MELTVGVERESKGAPEKDDEFDEHVATDVPRRVRNLQINFYSVSDSLLDS